MQPLACPACSTLAASTDVVCTQCGVALPGRGSARTGVPKWVWITGGVVLGCGGIGCIGLVATLVVPSVLKGFAHSGAAKARADIDMLTSAATEYATRNSGAFPESLELLWMPDANGYRYFDSDGPPRDVWGHVYEYRAPSAGSDWPLVFSLGPDGIAETSDDIHGSFGFDAMDEVDDMDPHARAEADIEEITVASIEYATRNGGAYPVSLEVLWMPDANGARYLEFDGPPLDPWGNVYVYRAPQTDEEDPLVFSAGPDGIAGTEDDVGVDNGSDDEDESDDASTEPR